MRRTLLVVWFVLLISECSTIDADQPKPPFKVIGIPPAGQVYHAIYPGGITGEEDDITSDDLRSYEQLVGKSATWVYFSHNWYHGRSFPIKTASWIRDAGSIPFIRLMLRSDAIQGHAEPTFSLRRILNGEFDADLRAWARAARVFESPLMAEYGTEVNGQWFPWNGVWNGGATLDRYGDRSLPDGAERFRDAYRHIIQLMREEGAYNILWVFHVNDDDDPDESWNRLEQYYPGDEWIDWIGVSVYGAQTPLREEWPQFRGLMDRVYPRLARLSQTKPILLLEFGVTSGNPLGDQATWAEEALTDLINWRWPRVIGFSWWNEIWENDDNSSHNTDMWVQDNPALASVFRRLIGMNEDVLGEPVLSDLIMPPTSVYIWHPPLLTSWQWQLTSPVDQSFIVDFYDIDLFDNDSNVVASLHAQGRKIACYISVGSWENWRPDADQFPAEVIGKDYEGWPGEKWLDIRQIELLGPIMRKRLDACKARGFDAVEPDNIDGYTNDTGFSLTYHDQITYNIWLADEAHSRGLSIGLKNDTDQVSDLVPYFDWVLSEECFYYQECELFMPFITAGKPVFNAEYTDTGMTTSQFCMQAKALNVNGILKHRELDAWQEACIADDAEGNLPETVSGAYPE